MHLVGRSWRVACVDGSGYFSPRRPVDYVVIVYCHFLVHFFVIVQRVPLPLRFFIFIFVYLWSWLVYLFCFERRHPSLIWGCGFLVPSCVGLWERTHCEPGLRTRPALHFRSLVPFCVGSWQALENSWIDLTGGKYNGSDSVGGVGGFPFALALALSRISLLVTTARHCECYTKDWSVYIADSTIFDCIYSSLYLS